MHRVCFTLAVVFSVASGQASEPTDSSGGNSSEAELAPWNDAFNFRHRASDDAYALFRLDKKFSECHDLLIEAAKKDGRFPVFWRFAAVALLKTGENRYDAQKVAEAKKLIEMARKTQYVNVGETDFTRKVDAAVAFGMTERGVGPFTEEWEVNVYRGNFQGLGVKPPPPMPQKPPYPTRRTWATFARPAR